MTKTLQEIVDANPDAETFRFGDSEVLCGQILALVRVILLDDQGVEVAEAFAQIAPSSIPADATALFAARVENPPFESFELELDLVPADTALADNGSTR